MLAASLIAGPAPAGPALSPETVPAPAESRTLTFVHTHRDDRLTVTFRRDGAYDKGALERLNWFLRDWRTNETTTMDPRLFDILWEMQREIGTEAPIHVISAYRSPATNGALRRKSGGVAEGSLHMAGQAIDVRMPGIDTARIRATAMQVQYGGVGFYPGSDFVHVDTGNVRAWPRMSKDQLIALFPAGKTLHLPPSGGALAGHQQARAEVQARLAALTAPPAARTPPRPVLASAGGVTAAFGPPVQVASADGTIATTGSLASQPRDERTLLKALFVAPAGPVSAASTPLMHMAAQDLPKPRAESLLAPPMPAAPFARLSRTDEAALPVAGRFTRTAVQPPGPPAAR